MNGYDIMAGLAAVGVLGMLVGLAIVCLVGIILERRGRRGR